MSRARPWCARAIRRACAFSKRRLAARRSSATRGRGWRPFRARARDSRRRHGRQVVAILQNLPESERRAIGRRARQRVLARAHRRSPRGRAGGHHPTVPPSPRPATSRLPTFMSKKIRVAIIGVGNCASSLVQGVQFYRDATRGRFRARPHARESRRLPPARHRVFRRLRHQRRTRSAGISARRSLPSRITPSASPKCRRWT